MVVYTFHLSTWEAEAELDQPPLNNKLEASQSYIVRLFLKDIYICIDIDIVREKQPPRPPTGEPL